MSTIGKMKDHKTTAQIVMDLIQDVFDSKTTLEPIRAPLTGGELQRIYNRTVANADGFDRANAIMLDVIDSDLSLTLRTFCSLLLANCVKIEAAASEEYHTRIRTLIRKERVPAIRIALAFSLSHSLLHNEARNILSQLRKKYRGNAETCHIVDFYLRHLAKREYLAETRRPLSTGANVLDRNVLQLLLDQSIIVERSKLPIRLENAIDPRNFDVTGLHIWRNKPMLVVGRIRKLANPITLILQTGVPIIEVWADFPPTNRQLWQSSSKDARTFNTTKDSSLRLTQLGSAQKRYLRS